MTDFLRAEVAERRFVKVSGELDMGSTARLEEALTAVSQEGSLFVDARALTFMDSSGIHSLLRALERLGADDCVFLHAPTGAIAKVLQLAGVNAMPRFHIIPWAEVPGTAPTN